MSENGREIINKYACRHLAFIVDVLSEAWDCTVVPGENGIGYSHGAEKVSEYVTKQ
jgi:hypothetical protein